MATGRALTVLVVDDDDADTMMIEEALMTAPIPPTVHRVADGTEALEYLRRNGGFADAVRPDFILLDLNMPRMNGNEVLVQLKSDDDLKTIPVVVLTTSNAGADIESSYAHHANAYVTKPIDLESFEGAVRQINRFYSDVATLAVRE
ncbi:response regulator [Actinoplanes sp. NPDC023936]|uniref:response regulator n=1 Tax=Actinoplanes sp. NPDC023936 TaxID=3154910 RepID=UPI0033F601BE